MGTLFYREWPNVRVRHSTVRVRNLHDGMRLRKRFVSLSDMRSVRIGPANVERFLNARPLQLDIETSGLKADYGIVFVIGVQAFTRRGRPEPIRQFVIDRRAKDWVAAEREMLVEFRAFMGWPELLPSGIITFNGTRFDVPFLQARLIAHGLPLLPKMRHVDLFYVVKNTLRYTITSRRSKYIQALFTLGDPRAPHKDSSEMMTWLNATFARDRAAFARIVNHNATECLPSLLYQSRRLAQLMPRTVPLR